MCVKFKILWYLLCAVSSVWSQDIIPELPDYAIKPTTTTTVTDKAALDTTTTNIETTIITTQPTTDGPATTTATPTEIPEMTSSGTTAPQTPGATTSEAVTPYPWHPKPQDPEQPNYPGYWHQRCYYKEQRGMAYLNWVCGNLHWVYTIDCYHCCYYEFSQFAGCFKMHSGHCSYYRK